MLRSNPSPPPPCQSRFRECCRGVPAVHGTDAVRFHTCTRRIQSRILQENFIARDPSLDPEQVGNVKRNCCCLCCLDQYACMLCEPVSMSICFQTLADAVVRWEGI